MSRLIIIAHKEVIYLYLYLFNTLLIIKKTHPSRWRARPKWVPDVATHKNSIQQGMLWQETSKTEVGIKIEFSPKVMAIFLRLGSLFLISYPHWGLFEIYIKSSIQHHIFIILATFLDPKKLCKSYVEAGTSKEKEASISLYCHNFWKTNPIFIPNLVFDVSCYSTPLCIEFVLCGARSGAHLSSKGKPPNLWILGVPPPHRRVLITSLDSLMKGDRTCDMLKI